MHARQEAVHAEQRALHEAEHSKAAERHAALKAASAAVGELILDIRPEPPATLPKEVARGGWHWIAKLMEMVIETEATGRGRLAFLRGAPLLGSGQASAARGKSRRLKERLPRLAERLPRLAESSCDQQKVAAARGRFPVGR